MSIIDTFKNKFSKISEGQNMNKKSLTTVFDHDRVGYNPAEYQRIADSFRIYSGRYDDIAYVNSYGEVMERPYMTLNMMNETAKLLGSILFNEQCEISFSEGTIDVPFIEHILQHNNFNKNFAQYVQVMLATGGLAVKPYYDVRTGEIEFSWALADTFIPLHSNTNSISEAVITSTTQSVEGSRIAYYTLMEFHEWAGDRYVISNELYKSRNAGRVGDNVPLNEVYEGLAEHTVYEGFSRPNFVYLKPFGFNNINPQSPLGLGICDNAKSTLEQINNTYDQYYWEVRQGKRRVIVSDHFMNTRIDRQGRPVHYFDRETDVYLALPGAIDDMDYKDITSNIRSEQYIESINKFLTTLELQVGLSTGTFTFDGRSVKTATQIVSENSMTYRTRNSHISNIEQFIQELIISTCELARETYNVYGVPLYNGNIPTKEDITVNFDDGIFADKNSELSFWAMAKQAGLAPTKEAIKRVHKLTDDEAADWAKKIKQEQSYEDPYEIQKRAESTLLGEYKE